MFLFLEKDYNLKFYFLYTVRFDPIAHYEDVLTPDCTVADRNSTGLGVLPYQTGGEDNQRLKLLTLDY